MSDEPTPNEGQRELIEADEGIYLVDAGAGTGKTFALTRRYANLLDDGVEPDDVLLATFTENAAAEMRERVVARTDYDAADLRDAPIGTFHSLAHEILMEHGFEAPAELGIDDRITSSTRIVEDEVLEAARFREFLDEFVEDHPEYADHLRVLADPTSLLDLVRALLAKGVFPTRDGWFRDGEKYLDGDFAAFVEQFADANEPGDGARGPTQSDALSSLLGDVRSACYRSDGPTDADVRGGEDGKRIPADLARDAFETDREDLKAFVHDVYFEYVAFALGRNYLTFGFLLMFAFALLAENPGVRSELRHEYVMVDEFQDTNEVQFKLALLLAGTDNLCVVGDWKQSIYGFQYAAVENILEFESRLRQFRAELNDPGADPTDEPGADSTDEPGADSTDDPGDGTNAGKSAGERVPYPVDDVTTITLDRNYRSTPSILAFSEHTLALEAVGREDLDADAIRDRITSLESTAPDDDSRIAAFAADDEHAALLTKLQAIVGNDEYAVRGEDGEFRPPTYGDVAVLTRTRDFGREFQQAATDAGVPAAYEGGVELFATDHAKLLLAWLRILSRTRADRGWAVVLERAGYTLAESRHLLETGEYPDHLVAFREELADAETVAGTVRRVLDRYGFDDAYADALVAKVTSVFEGTVRNRGELVRFLEESIRAGTTVEVDDSPGPDSVTVQTIHAAKGLEYPIVVVANVNRHRFPSTGAGQDRIRYEEPIGLRQTAVVDDEHGPVHRYDDWRYDVLASALPTDYDEERRLLYVATTRAEQHLLFSAGEQPSPFFEGLPLEPETVEPDVSRAEVGVDDGEPFAVDVAAGRGRRGLSAHDLMDASVFDEPADGTGPADAPGPAAEAPPADDERGMAFGSAVHEFAEAYARGEDVTPSNDDEANVRRFLDSLSGAVRIEEQAYLPVEVDGERRTVAGVVDLLHVTDDAVEVVDYKTDWTDDARDEYRKQVSVYHRVAAAAYPEREVRSSIFWTRDGERDDVDPLDATELADLVRAATE